MAAQKLNLTDLPPELLLHIGSFLYAWDRQKLRRLHPHFFHLLQRQFYEEQRLKIELEAFNSKVFYPGYAGKAEPCLCRILRLGRVDVLETLLDRGLTANDFDRRWCSIINMAVSFGCVGAARLLIARGLGSGFRWPPQWSVFGVSIWYCRDERRMPGFLEALQLVIDARCGDTPVALGPCRGNTLCWVMAGIEAGVGGDVSPRRAAVVHLLLRNGVDPRVIERHQLLNVDAWTEVCRQHYRPREGAGPLPAEWSLHESRVGGHERLPFSFPDLTDTSVGPFVHRVHLTGKL